MAEPVQRFSLVAQRGQQYAELARRMELGEDIDSISTAMGIAVPEIRRITAAQSFQSYLTQYRNRVLSHVDDRVAERYDTVMQLQETISRDAGKYYNVLADIAQNSKNDNVRAKICMYLLDRATKFGMDSLTNEIKLDANTIQMLQVVMTEAKQIQAMDYDADV